MLAVSDGILDHMAPATTCIDSPWSRPGRGFVASKALISWRSIAVGTAIIITMIYRAVQDAASSVFVPSEAARRIGSSTDTHAI